MKVARISLRVALAALLLILPLSTLAAGPTVTLSPNPLTLGVGQTLPVQLKVADVTDLYGFEVHLKFDPAVIQIEDADKNTPGVQMLPGDFLSYDFPVKNEVDNVAGVAGYALTQINPSKPKSGAGVLLTILITGKAAGSAKLELLQTTEANTQLASVNGEKIEVALPRGEVRVTSGSTTTQAVTPTPLPVIPTPQIDLTQAVEQQALTPEAATPAATVPAPTDAPPATTAPATAAPATVAPGASPTLAPAEVTAPTSNAPGAALTTDATPVPATATPVAAAGAQAGAAESPTAAVVAQAGSGEQPQAAAAVAPEPEGLNAPTRVQAASQEGRSNTLLFAGGGLLLLAAAGAIGLVVLRRGK